MASEPFAAVDSVCGRLDGFECLLEVADDVGTVFAAAGDAYEPFAEGPDERPHRRAH
ncbi:MAG TPA: hypothetical protein VHV31_17025 [Nitrolancea sp.]|nr:hypothetical protein [Nitrolancea sp.]